MSTLTPRGRTAVVLAFVVSAVLCGGAAVALVQASKDSKAPVSQALPSAQPSLIPGEATSPTPAPVASPVVTVPPTTAPTSTPTASAVPSPAATHASPRATRSPAPRVSATPPGDIQGLTATARIDDADTTTGTVIHAFAHATDQAGTISKATVTWGDGASEVLTSKVCAHAAGADCRDFSGIGHPYQTPGDYTVTITIVASDHTTNLTIPVKVS